MRLTLCLLQVALRSSLGLKRFRAAAKSGGTADSGVGEDFQDAQEFKLRFRVPAAGIYNLQVMCLSDTWIGCDAKTPLKLKVRQTIAAGTRITPFTLCKRQVAKTKKTQDVAILEASQTDAREDSEDDQQHEVGDGQADDGDLTEDGTSESDADS